MGVRSVRLRPDCRNNMRYMLTAAIIVTVSLVVAAQPADLLAARAAMSAAIAAQDKPAYAQFLSDDITSIDSAGKLRDKAAAVAEMPAGNAQTNAEISEYEDSAVIAIGYDRAGESPARIIQAWSRKPVGWQMVAFQGVRAIGTVAPSSQASSPMPPSSQPERDRDSVMRTIEALRSASTNHDEQAWAALVTDRFVATSSTGAFQRKADVARRIATGASAGDVLDVRQISVRVHGTLAVANFLLVDPGNTEFWRTAIFINQRNSWREAAEITTTITGAARATRPAPMTDHQP